MAIYNASIDPYSAQTARYECHDCGTRFEADAQTGKCPGCGASAIQNLSVSRE